VNRQIEAIGSYTEISPSGRGLKAIARAKKPEKPVIRCSTKETPWSDEFAVYEKGRFFTLTGRVFGGYREIRARRTPAPVSTA
jgi:primase-polymerase (primpol)-like protein